MLWKKKPSTGKKTMMHKTKPIEQNHLHPLHKPLIHKQAKYKAATSGA
jgi:hypothetical protein